MKFTHCLPLGIIASLMTLGTAFAHHPMGGSTPTSLFEGLLSGIGHPIIGIDHLAFVIAVGIASAFVKRSKVMPLAFIAATIAGCALIYSGITLPAVETTISLSVLLLGVAVMSGRSLSPMLYAAFFAITGLFHGWAYGEAIIGAEATPLLAYLTGFAVTQYIIAAGAGLLMRSTWNATSSISLQPRLAGAAVAGIGFVFVAEIVESAVL